MMHLFQALWANVIAIIVSKQTTPGIYCAGILSMAMIILIKNIFFCNK